MKTKKKLEKLSQRVSSIERSLVCTKDNKLEIIQKLCEKLGHDFKLNTNFLDTDWSWAWILPDDKLMRQGKMFKFTCKICGKTIVKNQKDLTKLEITALKKLGLLE